MDIKDCCASAEEPSMTFSEVDKMIMESYKSLLEGMSDYLGQGYEFVLHSLENLDSSVIKIINGYYTGREEGAPITDLALRMLSDIQCSDSEIYKSYYTFNKKGSPMKSTTIGIKGDGGRIIGLLCINFYLDTSFSEVLKNFYPQDKERDIVVKELYPSNVDELVNNVVNETRDSVMADELISPGRKNREVVRKLYEQGYFSIKDSVPQAAEILGVSKNTIYMHLRKMTELGKEK